MKPVVSISCLVYNHERYLRRTLEGFMEQKTDFPFEVIVHDDASTDGSRQIIEEYVQRYPHIFVPVFQQENQFSRKVPISRTFIYPRCRGEYIAFCEGDDYWCDPNKLQIQIDYMRANPNCSLCVHDTERVDANDCCLGTTVNGLLSDRDYSAREVIAAQGGGLFQTSSVICRRDVVFVPDEFRIKGIGDYSLAIYASMLGTVHYIGRIMSRYRIHSSSWVHLFEKDSAFKMSHLEDLVSGLRSINKATHYRYWPEISYIVGIRLYQLYTYKYNRLSILLKPFDCMYVIRVLPHMFMIRLKQFIKLLLRK